MGIMRLYAVCINVRRGKEEACQVKKKACCLKEKASQWFYTGQWQASSFGAIQRPMMPKQPRFVQHCKMQLKPLGKGIRCTLGICTTLAPSSPGSSTHMG